MAFEATKREWGELYAFFRLLADGYVYAGTPDVKRNEVQKLPVAMVQREEHDGTRRYILEDEATVRICGEKIDKQIPRGDFAAVAELVFAAVKESRENDVMSPDGVEEFLAYIIHSGFISGYQNRYGDNLKPPTNVYHRMTA